MRNYRTIDETASNNDPSTLTKAIDAWEQYVADYEADVEGDISITEQTIDDEFNAYNLSLPNRNVVLDTVKFWEVGC